MKITLGKPRSLVVKKVVPVSRLKKKLWELVRQVVFKKYGNTCYTCGAKNLFGQNLQAGHFIPSSVGGVGLRYELLQIRPQCFRCNISLSGNWPAYYERMVKELGKKGVGMLMKRKAIILKADRHYYEEKIEEMRGLVHFLEM